MVAMKLILQYVLGKPTETVDPDRIAIDEWRKLRDAAVDLDETSAMLEQVPANMACFLMKKLWPGETVENVRDMLEANAEAKAEAEEDERYLEAREKAEEEAMRQKAGSGDPRQTSSDPRPTSPQPARPTPSPSTNRENGSKSSNQPTPSPSPNRENRIKSQRQSPERQRRVAEPVVHAPGSIERQLYSSPGGNGNRPPSPYGALGDFLTESDLTKYATEGKRGKRRR